VSSGHGVHVYWLLDEPYLIDDAGDPPCVQTEWVERPDGKRKALKYIIQDGERLYLDRRPDLKQLSPKALHFQDVLSGVAQVVGGDHVQDVARLLRLPGTMNRKDQRNGQEPVPCELVVCEPDRRYPISTFERYAKPSADTVQREKLAQIKLPKTRKKLSPTKLDKFHALINAAAVAEKGERSELDFHVCCEAIRCGMPKEQLWEELQDVGKFSEGGITYFDRTWRAAEYRCRFDLLQKAQKRARHPTHRDGGQRDSGNTDDVEPQSQPQHKRPVIVVNPQNTQVHKTIRQITDCLIESHKCFQRNGQLVAIDADKVTAILESKDFVSLANQFMEFWWIGKELAEYKTLPSSYANVWLGSSLELDRLPALRLFSRGPVFNQHFELAPPGYDPKSGIFYAGPAIEPRSSTEHLDRLLAEFCFAQPGDRTNYLGLLLTNLLVFNFAGAKPAAIFNGNQSGIGKSILAMVAAILREGRYVSTVTFNSNDEEFEKRLATRVRADQMTIIIDNAKCRRKERIESGCLERCITDPILSFRLLSRNLDITSENFHVFAITANSAEVGADILSRSLVVNLFWEGNPKRRSFEIKDPEAYAIKHRGEILGELIGMVERWKAAGKPLADVHSRFNKKNWGGIVGGILHVSGATDFMGNAQEASAMDETRRDFESLVELMMESAAWDFAAEALVEMCLRNGLLERDLGTGSKKSMSTKMGIVATRFIEESFTLDDGRKVKLTKGSDKKGKSLYRVEDVG
jgi:hypothetical protein